MDGTFQKLLKRLDRNDLIKFLKIVVTKTATYFYYAFLSQVVHIAPVAFPYDVQIATLEQDRDCQQDNIHHVYMNSTTIVSGVKTIEG